MRIAKGKWNYNECRFECKELDYSGFFKNDYMWNQSMCDFECNKACKVDKYLDIRNYSCEKCLIGKLVLEYEDEILNTTLLNNKKVAYAKRNCLIHTISSIIICLLSLFVTCVICYFYYKKCRSKQIHLLQFHNIVK